MEEKEIFTIPHADGNLLYAPLQGKVMFSKEDFRKKTEDELFDILMKQGTNLYSKKEETDYFNRLPSDLVLLPTRNCNLRCKYCYSSGGDSKENLKWPVAKAAIDFCFKEQLKKGADTFNIWITGGGEPTLNWEVTTKSVNYARDLCEKEGIKLVAELVTNGTFNDEKLEWIIKNISKFYVSFDILEDIQNSQRPLSDGKPSYKIVFDNLKKIDSKGVKFGIRSTISDESVHRMPEMIRFACDSFKNIKYIYIVPLFKIGRCSKTNIDRPENRVFIKYFLEAKEIAFKKGVDIGCFVNVSTEKVTNSFCGALRNNFVLTPEGLITACQDIDTLSNPYADVFIYGSYDLGQKTFSFNLNRLNRLRKRTVDKIPECKDCFVKYQCCGGCASVALMNTKDLFKPDKSSCQFVKSFFAKDLYYKTLE